MVRDVVRRARELLEAGDQEQAHAILALALDAPRRAAEDMEAIAVAEATGMLVQLEAPCEPRDALERRIARMTELTDGFDADAVREARALAELESIEWVHRHEPDDAIVLVDVLRAAESFAARHIGDDQPLGVRQARAEALFTAEILRRHLGRDRHRVAVGLETLALTLTAESDERLRHLRIAALYQAARIRYDSGDDPESAVALMHRVVAEAEPLPSARALLHAASLCLVDDEIGRGAPAAVAIGHGLRALDVPVADPGFEAATEQARHLDQVLERLPDTERDRAAAEHSAALVDRYATCAAEDAREAILWWVLRGVPEDAGAVTTVDRQVLAHADHAFDTDPSPLTAAARARVASRLAEVTAHLGDPAGAVRLYERLEAQFPGHEHDERLVVPLALAMVDRALRLADIGRRGDALEALAQVPHRYAPAAGVPGVPAAIAQAVYWRGRLLREAGELAESRRVIRDTVDRSAVDADADVRLWAANSLFSVWQSPGLDPTEIDDALHRFADLFADDPDVRIRRLDARRRLVQSTRAAERGERGVAATLLQGLVASHADSDDPDIRDTVELAAENRRILEITSPTDAAPASAGEARYRDLRERLYGADRAVDEGRRADAEEILAAIAADTVVDPDENIVMLGLAALDVLGGLLLDAGRWEELVAAARSAALRRPGLDTRARRVHARGHLRLGIALGRLGEEGAAIEAYEALERLADGATDGDIVNAREVATYNRAVLVDGLGDPVAAIAAYDHVLRIHDQSVDSAERRLRRVKTLRNKALLLTGLGRLPDATHAHRTILDIAGAFPDAEIAARGRKSAFDLAACYTRLGQHRVASDLYTWMRSARHLGFTRDELKSITRSAKTAARESKRAHR
ncbi:hypothetical protein [Rhodococcus tukisamuensis]|uniref:Tetratricopeptide repeat-containing protein n=1 Tax=Rhodococcus tukisamuensis TaxID=168276 RepID=A0A1G6X3Z2_9NOCA|nr:hypothetical protein [Rhodococcus tukisamuensis]SDD72900.1 hypothetical protein SAMN05444580_10681 [Rhodococcus tukisamuensis]